MQPNAAGALAGMALMVAGCTSGPDFHPPDTFAPPAFMTHGVPATDLPDPAWWRVLDDPVLTTLMDRLPGANLDMRIATARLAQVRAARTVSGGTGAPVLNAGAAYDRDRIARDGPLRLLPGPVTQAARKPFDLFDAGFDASWELDLWGRVKRTREASDATVLAGTEDRRAVLVAVQAELARIYIALRRAQALAALTARFAVAPGIAGGLAGALAASRVPSLRAEVALRENALALLTGAPPGGLAALLDAPAPVPPVPPAVPLGLPSQLLERRPDVRAAIARLHAATASIGVAEAEFLPRVTLSGSVGLQALQPKYLGGLGAVGYAAGPGITIPVFSGGRLTGQLELRRAEQTEAALAFQAAALGAFHDVDDALIAYAADGERRTALIRAAALSQTPAERYEVGAQLIDSTAALATDLVVLFKALGGGWQAALPTPAPGAAAP